MRAGHQVTDVSSNIIVPKVSFWNNVGKSPYATSMWVGMDGGFGDSSTLEQVGLWLQTGRYPWQPVTYRVFYEVLPHDPVIVPFTQADAVSTVYQSNPPKPGSKTPIVVKPGDNLHMYVGYGIGSSKSGYFELEINLNGKEYVHFEKAPGAKRSTVEVITEAEAPGLFAGIANVGTIHYTETGYSVQGQTDGAGEFFGQPDYAYGAPTGTRLTATEPGHQHMITTGLSWDPYAGEAGHITQKTSFDTFFHRWG